MTHYSIKCVGFDLPQQESISAILDLADSALTSIWRVSEAEDTDVLLINLEAENALQTLATAQQNRPAYRIVLVGAVPLEKDADNYWFLAKKSHAPPSLKELIKLFNQIESVLAEAALAQTALAEPSPLKLAATDNLAGTPELAVIDSPAGVHEPTATDSPAETPVPEPQEIAPPFIEDSGQNASPKSALALTRPLYPRNYFFGTLLQARKDKACRALRLNRLPALYLAPTDDCYYFAGTEAELAAYCTAAPQYLEETVATKQKLAKMLKSAGPIDQQALDGLIVRAVIVASQGRLLEGHSPEQAISLSQVPDTDKLPLLAPYQKIAEFMRQQPCNLFQAAESLQIPLSAIFEFYNVCFLMGYCTTAANLPIATLIEPAEPKQTGALGHFLKSFFKK